MDALEFAKEHDRMCHMYHGDNCIGNDDNCPLREKCTAVDWQQAVPIVEKWSKEHPTMRNVDHVAEGLEKLGFKVNKNHIVTQVCPMPYSSYFDSLNTHCPEGVIRCVECRKWWLKEYKEK